MHAHSRWTGELIASGLCAPRTEFSSPTAGSLEVARLPLHWGPVLDQVFRGRIDFFRRQEHHCPYARAPRLANGKANAAALSLSGRSATAKASWSPRGEVEVLQPSPNTLGGSGHGFASTASALASETLDALHRVRRLKQEPWHQAPLSAVVAQPSHCGADLLKVSPGRQRGEPAAPVGRCLFGRGRLTTSAAQPGHPSGADAGNPA